MKKIKLYISTLSTITLLYSIINCAEHIVVKGDCLWNIAKYYYKNPFLWKKIYEFNKEQISNPDLIYPGQRFFLPDIEEMTSKELTKTEKQILQTTILEEKKMQPEEIVPNEKTVIEEINKEDLTDELQTAEEETEKQEEIVIKEKEETIEIIQPKPQIEEKTKIFPKKIKYDESKINGIIKNAKEKKFVYIDFDIVYCEVKNSSIFKKDDILGIYHLGPSQYDTSLMNVPKDELNLVGIMKVKETDDKKSYITGEVLRCFSPIIINDLIINQSE